MRINFYLGPPYQKKERVFTVDIDQFAILQGKNCYVYEMKEDKSVFVDKIDNVDNLCTDRVSSCIGIYAECPNGIVALAHLSVSCGLINQKLVDISDAIRTIVETQDIVFYLYGGTPNTYEVVTDNDSAPIAAPSGCLLDQAPQLTNRDTEEGDEEGDETEEGVDEDGNLKGELEEGSFGNGVSTGNPEFSYPIDDENSGDLEQKDDVLSIFQCERALLINKFDAETGETKWYRKEFGSSNLFELTNQQSSTSQTNEKEEEKKEISITSQPVDEDLERAEEKCEIPQSEFGVKRKNEGLRSPTITSSPPRKKDFAQFYARSGNEPKNTSVPPVIGFTKNRGK